MELEISAVETTDEYLEPALAFDVTIEFSKYDEAVIVLGGRLKSANKIISTLEEWIPESRSGELLHSSTLGAEPNNINQDYGHGDSASLTTRLYAPIGTEGVEHLENQREKNNRGNVSLKILLEVEILRNKMEFSAMRGIDPDDYNLEAHRRGGNTERILVRERMKSSRSEFEYLEPSDFPSYLEIGRTVLRAKMTIPSNEWIHDYAPELGVVDRLTIELPNPSDIDDDSEVLSEAINELHRAREELRRGEWLNCTHILQNEVLELIDPNKGAEDLWELADIGYSPEAEQKLRATGSVFQDYAGKFRHRRKSGGDQEIMGDTEPRREDAYFLYTTVAGIVQLLAHKEAARQGENEFQ